MIIINFLTAINFIIFNTGNFIENEFVRVETKWNLYEETKKKLIYEVSFNIINKKESEIYYSASKIKNIEKLINSNSGSEDISNENFDNARKRGAEILAEVIGYAMSSDASDIVMPSKQGAARAIKGALIDAQLNSEEVQYINAHGTGTAANDKTECAAVADVFGKHADNLMISSTKSMHGHVIGGTGAIELLACILAVRDGIVAPTIGYEEADPECALDVVPNQSREAKVDVALSNAFAFGGLNAVLAIRSV